MEGCCEQIHATTISVIFCRYRLYSGGIWICFNERRYIPLYGVDRSQIMSTSHIIFWITSIIGSVMGFFLVLGAFMEVMG